MRKKKEKKRILPTGSRYEIAIEIERIVFYASVLAGAMQSGFIKYCIVLLLYRVILLSRTITMQNDGAMVSCVCVCVSVCAPTRRDYNNRCFVYGARDN